MPPRCSGAAPITHSEHLCGAVPCRAPQRCATLWERRDEACRGTWIPAASSGPATGDWLSGRAPRSHRGGHWFDPSIAHQVRGQVRGSTDSSHPTQGGGAVAALGAIWEIFSRPVPRACEEQRDRQLLGPPARCGADLREQVVEQSTGEYG